MVAAGDAVKQEVRAVPHAHEAGAVLAALDSSRHGLDPAEAAARLTRHGPNELPRPRPPGLATVFLRQFASPLIYVLLAAAVLSLAIEEWSDATFIFAVLFINAVIGTAQEYSAQRAASALQALVADQCRVLRAGESYVIDARELVPGDVLLLESGDRVPADGRLFQAHDLEADESQLTGESLPVTKDAAAVLAPETPLGDRRNMVYAGSLVLRGRAQAVVVHTGLDTELGRIASAVVGEAAAEAPLLVRMRRFTHWVAAAVGVAALVLAAVSLARGMPLSEVFLLAVALAVSAIPEGLPVALTVALAISMRRMARRHVIVRRLLAVEALGSCTFIATDKTGTLTVNQLTVRRIGLPDGRVWEVTGEGLAPEGRVLTSRGEPDADEERLLRRIALAAVLPNEGFLGQRDGHWVAGGDTVDVALLVLAHKVGVVREEALNANPELGLIPFESERLYAASLNRTPEGAQVFVKGAVERLLPMCTRMATPAGDEPLDRARVEAQVLALARDGYRVLALAAGDWPPGTPFEEARLGGLTFLGLLAMLDPLRPEAKAAVAACREAGIEVAMVTGDHPATALAIARELDLAREPAQVVTGVQLRRLGTGPELERVVLGARVFARVEPRQKLDIVHVLERAGHFVAVTGDGANDAPALRAAEVGVAMGKSGTDVARESADLIITDDNFASIVAGIEEGRIAYGNVRKVIYLLVSTGAAEIVLFGLALFTGLPLPLVAVQLLWLNLVTNGIQDVALAFEPGEGQELRRPPRPPREPIFDRLMLERLAAGALAIGVPAFLLFQYLLAQGYSVGEARNGTLLLMVLFENIHVFNCRSETRSVFRHSPLRNPLLLAGTLAAQGVHIGAMYTPGLSDVLGVQPVSPGHWLQLLAIALVVLAVMELHKLWWRWRTGGARTAS